MANSTFGLDYIRTHPEIQVRNYKKIFQSFLKASFRDHTLTRESVDRFIHQYMPKGTGLEYRTCYEMYHTFMKNKEFETEHFYLEPLGEIMCTLVKFKHSSPFLQQNLERYTKENIDHLDEFRGISWKSYFGLWKCNHISDSIIMCLPQCWNPSETNLPKTCPAIDRIHHIHQTGFYCVDQVAL